MHHQNWLSFIWDNIDKHSLAFVGGTGGLSVWAGITNHWVPLFFTVIVGTTATLYNVINTKITLDREKREKEEWRREREEWEEEKRTRRN